MNIQALKDEIEAWAADAGQESVAIEVTRAFFEIGGDPAIRLYPIEHNGAVDWKAIYNNRQQLFRWLRADTAASYRKLEALAPIFHTVLPAERRARLLGETGTTYLLTVAIREFSTAVIAVMLNDRDVTQRIEMACGAMHAVSQKNMRMTTA